MVSWSAMVPAASAVLPSRPPPLAVATVLYFASTGMLYSRAIELFAQGTNRRNYLYPCLVLTQGFVGELMLSLPFGCALGAARASLAMQREADWPPALS